MIHLYAITEGLTGLPSVKGIGGTPLTRHAHEGLDLVLTEHHDAFEVGEYAVLTHARVVDALMPLATSVLPARLGRGYADLVAMEDAVRFRAEAIREALARVRGCVELGVHVVGDEPTEPVASSGREYMVSLARTTGLAEDLHAPLAELSRETARTKPLGSRLLLSGAYLLQPRDVPLFERAVGELQATHAELAIAVTGPWPPYSFAEVRE